MADDQQQVKKAKITDFWTNVKTRKTCENSENWKLIHGSVLSKVYGQALQLGKTYRVCAFDLDNTLITTNSGKILAKDARDWKFNYPIVPKMLNELFDSNTSAAIESILVIFSNQLNLNSKVAERAAFETKIDSVISKLGVSGKCTVICLFATARDEFRKPCMGMWKILKEEILKIHQCEIDMNQSFFVGDAAGRLASWKPGRSADWSSVDHKFALNVGLKFLTPEEFFLKDEPVKTYDLGRDPKRLPATLGIDDKFIFQNQDQSDAIFMIIAVGSPASGKSTMYNRHFKKLNYAHINRDTLKTIPKCLNAVRSAFKNKQSVYIDNTNPTIESRALFLNLAKEMNVSVKCLHFIADEWLCKHLDAFRSIRNKVDPLPHVAFNTFRAKYQPPTESEGFETIIKVPFEAYFTTEDELSLFQSYLF